MHEARSGPSWKTLQNLQTAAQRSSCLPQDTSALSNLTLWRRPSSQKSRVRRNEALSALTTFLNALKTLLLKKDESKTKTLKAEADLPKSLTSLLTKLQTELAVRRACTRFHFRAHASLLHLALRCVRLVSHKPPLIVHVSNASQITNCCQRLGLINPVGACRN